MKKMFKLLESVNNYNSFDVVDIFEHVNGNQQDIYFRLIQKFSGNQPNFNDLRWLPSSSAQVTVNFDSLDQANVINRVATMVYPNDDRSIWKLTLLAADVISGSMKLTLTDNGITETLLLDGRLIASGTGSSQFFC